jgi:RNA polymerase sigma-70 factor (ECF subfamily)
MATVSLKSRWDQHRRDRRHARWVRQARAGDPHAFARLYGELYDPVADYLEPRAPTLEDAEDLIATVFHRFLKNLARYDAQRGCVLAWLLTMARHALIDHLRARRPQVPVDDLADVLAGPSPDPLAGLIRTEQADRVRRALAEQPALVRELFALHYGQGLRLREIGDLLGMSEDAVKQRLSRVRRDLRDRLRDERRDGARSGPTRGLARASEGEV